MASDSGTHHNATWVRPSQTNAGQVSSKHQPASCQAQTPAPGQAASSAVPSKASGTTTKVHHGIATRLASGPTSDACPNRLTVSGNRPMVATACADRNPRNIERSSAGRHHTSHATPAKLSQKPATNTLNGSHSSTANIANARICAVLARRRSTRASATTAIINTVRTVGSARPASTA